MRMAALVENETLKILRRRRFLVIVAILAVILSVIAYSQYRQLERKAGREWRVELQQRVARYQNRLRRGNISESWARSLRAEMTRLQFYLDHGIDPERPTAPLFVRQFASTAGYLLLPLLVAVLGSDIVSSETAAGTDKLLMTRPVRRWKILLSKWITLALFTTLTLLAGALLAWLAASAVLEPRGWSAPVFSGFHLNGSRVELEGVRQLPLWQDTLMAFGLEWYALLCVGSIALLLSVIFRSSSAAIGTMLASLIGGTILTRVSPDWTAGKYLFVSGVPLTAYYSGDPTPYDGMSLQFCIALLGIWAVASLVVAFWLFVRRDIFG